MEGSTIVKDLTIFCRNIMILLAFFKRQVFSFFSFFHFWDIFCLLKKFNENAHIGNSQAGNSLDIRTAFSTG